VLGHSKISAFALRMEAASFYFFEKIKDLPAGRQVQRTAWCLLLEKKASEHHKKTPKNKFRSS